MRHRRRLFWLLGVSLAVPALALGAIGILAMFQDRRLAESQAREAVETDAARAAADVERSLRDWDVLLQRVLSEPEIPPAGSWPASLRPDTDSGALVLRVGQGRIRAAPAGRLLYDPRAIVPEESRTLPAALLAAERLELVNRNYDAAIAAYRILASSSSQAHVRAVGLHRLGRALRSAGRFDRARQAFEELAGLGQTRPAEGAEPVAVGSVPADLLGRFESCGVARRMDEGAEEARACAAALYRDLARGAWVIDKARFTFYLAEARAWTEAAGAPIDARSDEEQALRDRRDVSAAAEAAVAVAAETLDARGPRVDIVGRGQSTHLVIWRRAKEDGRTADGSATEPATAFLLARATGPGLRKALFAEPGTPGFRRWARIGDRLDVASGDPPPAEAERLVASRTLAWGGMTWRVSSTPADPRAIYATAARRQWLLGGMLALLASAIAVTGWLMTRAFRREFEAAQFQRHVMSAVSHELRSPVTGIRHVSEMLLDGRVSGEERRQQYYGLLALESRRLGRMVDQVLELSRIEEGRKTYTFESIATSAWLRGIVGEFRSRESGQDRLETSLPDDLPEIFADREAMTSAVHNLLDNAVKYSPPESPIRLVADATAHHVSIRIVDRGIGIPDEDRPHVFERFYRGSEAAGTAQGSGLGLALVRHIVDAHGGQVTIDSEIGVGSTFTLTLPVHASEGRR